MDTFTFGLMPFLAFMKGQRTRWKRLMMSGFFPEFLSSILIIQFFFRSGAVRGVEGKRHNEKENTLNFHTFSPRTF